MKRILVSILLCFTTLAQAQHHHYNGTGNNWVAPLVIGGLVGAAIARPTQPTIVYQPPSIVYNPVPTYYQCLVQVYDPVTGLYRNEVMTCAR